MLGVDGVARAQATTVPEKDATEIRAELQGMQDAWNRHDMKAFVSCMSDDVEWVNVVEGEGSGVSGARGLSPDDI